MNKYYRTAGSKTFTKGKDENYYPLKWTTVEAESTATFWDCYNKKLKINDFDKYGPKEKRASGGQWIENIDRPSMAIREFYRKGTFEFFVNLEQ